MESLIKFVQDEFVTKKDFPEFSAGDTITVFYEIREGEKTRTQFFRGVVIQVKGYRSFKNFYYQKNVRYCWGRKNLPSKHASSSES